MKEEVAEEDAEPVNVWADLDDTDGDPFSLSASEAEVDAKDAVP